MTVDLGLTTAQGVGGGMGTDTIVNVENIIGSTYGDTLTGSSLANIITGGDGDDGLVGGGGDDILIGGAGRDALTGSVGNDRFVYLATSDSTPGANADRITDLALGDILDLSGIDANANLAGDQAFIRVGALTGIARQMTLTYDAMTSTTTLLADINGDAVADFSILFSGNVSSAVIANWVL